MRIATAFTAALTGLMLMLPVTAPIAAAAERVRIGQATTTLSFLPIYAARALDSFKDAGMALEWAAISGGDPNTLAALDSGDIDFAAVGSDTVVQAVAKGASFEIVYSLMSRVTLELVLSNDFLKRHAVDPSAPLPQRIAALRDATIGVSAVGGAQDRTLRWLAKQGGLDPSKDLKVAQIGPPPAIQAALENHRIDGFLLSPPQGYIAEQRKYGRVVIKLGDELPQLRDLPYLVLVAKTPLDEAAKKRATETARVLQQASAKTLADTTAVAAEIQRRFFPKADPGAIASAVESMKSGIADKGQLTADGMTRLLELARESGISVPTDVGAKAGEGRFWTDEFVAAASKAP